MQLFFQDKGENRWGSIYCDAYSANLLNDEPLRCVGTLYSQIF